MQVVPIKSARLIGELSCGILVLMFPVANRTRLLLLACLACCFDEAVCVFHHHYHHHLPLPPLLFASRFSNNWRISGYLRKSAERKVRIKEQNSYKNVKVSSSDDFGEITRFTVNRQGCKCIVETNPVLFALSPGTRLKQTC